MSATNRGAERRPGDRYYTPVWPVYRFLEAAPMWPGSRWLEPSVGNGAIVRAVDSWYQAEGLEAPTWRACDISPAAIESLDEIDVGHSMIEHAAVGDYVRGALDPEIRGEQFSAAMGNPPYTEAFRFVKQALTHCDVVAFLLRLNWLASEERRAWLAENTPDVYVLPNRPDFTGGGGDQTEYAWMVWRNRADGRVTGVPQIKILATTPASERRAA